jgi:hypothetical protein
MELVGFMNKSVLIRVLSAVLIVVLTAACDRLPSISRAGENPVALTIEQVAETGQPGAFTLSGTATLPNQTPLTISAVRRLSTEANDSSSEPEPLFSILDRKSAVVQDGRWQAQLTLWQVSPEGFYQEPWQRTGDGLAPSQASSTVEFRAALEPPDLSRAKVKNRAAILDQATNPLLNFTPEGQPYLTVSESRVVALPSSSVAASAGMPTASRPGWQGRSLTDSPANSLTERQPLPFQESDNLPIPETNLLR